MGGVDTTSPSTIGSSDLGKTLLYKVAGNKTLTSGLGVGSQFTVILDAGVTGGVNINRSGGETINGATFVTLDTDYAGATFVKCDTDAWYAVGLLA